jgi:protein mago nashi
MSSSRNGVGLPPFYLRYYVGHRGQYGHEFLEYEVRPNGLLRYANNSNYRNDRMIKRDVLLAPAILDLLAEIIKSSGLFQHLGRDHGHTHDDSHTSGDYHSYSPNHSAGKENLTPRGWPRPDRDGRQELEVVVDGVHHLRLACSQLGPLHHRRQCDNCDDQESRTPPMSLQCFHHVVQDLKTLILALISMHFKVKPILSSSS